jgi:hypothetical protein
MVVTCYSARRRCVPVGAPPPLAGPPVSALKAMGSKASAKAIMTKAGVPVTPAYYGEVMLMRELDVLTIACTNHRMHRQVRPSLRGSEALPHCRVQEAALPCLRPAATRPLKS